MRQGHGLSDAGDSGNTYSDPMTRRRLVSLPPFLLAAGLVASPLAPVATAAAAEAQGQAVQAQGTVIAAYSLVAPRSVAKSQLLARVITTGGPCPTLVVKKQSNKVKSLAMILRPRPANTDPYFTGVAVCDRKLPKNTKKAKAGGRKVPAALPENVRRMALFADTGCRISEYKGNYEIQNCNQPSNPTRGWPLNQIAKSIAADKPDVILNPGDYFYREANCPTWKFTWAAAACGGSPTVPTSAYPFTDSAAGWRADVFTPMAPLFPVAPIAMLRGNHEACFRAGNGFFYFLDPRPGTSGTCAPTIAGGKRRAPDNATTPTWSASLDLIRGRTLKIAMVDSAYGNDTAIDSWANIQRPTYQAAANQTQPGTNQEAWLLTHRPIIGHTSSWISADQTAASKGLLGNYNLILSSHIHVVQGVKIPGLPPSLVMGNGGTSLDRNPGKMTKPLRSGATTYPNATTDWSASKWGYAIATAGKSQKTWTITQKSQNGTPFAACRLQQRAMTCS